MLSTLPDDAPAPVAIHVGGRCNNNCAFCAANLGRPSRSGAEIGADCVAAARRGAAALDVGGGELTAHPEVRGILRVLKRIRLPWSLDTNGRLFSADGVAAAFAGAGMGEARVSVHGPEGIHDALSGVAGSHAQAAAGIAALRAEGVRVGVSTVLTLPLVRGCAPEAFAAEVAALGVRELTCRPVCLEPELDDRWDELVPDLASLLAWAAGLTRAFDGTVRVHGIDEALLPEVGHLRFRPGEPVEGFDVESCAFRARTRAPPSGIDGLIERDGDAYRLWHLETPAPEPMQLAARLNHGQVWRAREAGAPVPLALSPRCGECHRLHECPAVYERAGDATPPVPAPREGEVELLTREIWLVDRGAEPPARPAPLEPAAVLRALREDGLVPLSYEQPSSERRQPFRARLAPRDEVDDPLARVRHQGVSLQVTESCMCRCVMCNLANYYKTPLMPLPRILRTLEEAALLGVRLADLFGGEVTLRKDLFQLVRTVRWLGMECMFITTGYYLTPEMVDRLADAGADRIVVSIDGSRPEIHDGIRRLPGIFERAVAALRALADAGALEAFASTVILSENLWDLPDLVRQSARLGITKHEFFLPISGPVSSTVPRWPTPDEMESLLDEILPEMEEVARETGVEIDFRPELRKWTLPREEMIGMISSGVYNLHAHDPASRCQAPGFNLFVTVNGNVYPCDMPALFHRDAALGNVGESSLLEVVTSDAMRAFTARAGHHEGCRMCVGRYEALGEVGG